MDKLTLKSDLTATGDDVGAEGLGCDGNGLPCWATIDELGDINGDEVAKSIFTGEANGLDIFCGMLLCTKSVFPKLDNCWVTPKSPPSSTVIITHITSEIIKEP